MTISYKWLSEYLPVKIEPERLSKILTSIGLEVESFGKYEDVRGGMKGMVIGQVMECEKHPNADKLSLTKVDIGKPDLLQIVCGAPNVAKGQKVIVAPVGSTIHPVNGEPLLMKVAKIRGVESNGMICAEDELGLGEDHSGILILNNNAVPGTPASAYFNLYEDWVYEIGLTPNRMDAMSHLGVAKDVCAYMSHHEKNSYTVISPFHATFKPDSKKLTIPVTVENSQACRRYSGISIAGITIKESPEWLQKRLKTIGQRPINNIVDITNFILHETGQPLHAFDADEIAGGKVIVKNLAEGTKFITLDEKERKLSAEDLMICNANGEGMCIGGVFGGIKSGINDKTKNIFLESAWFDPVTIRKTSFRHDLRTDAAMRFEKGVDISNTVNVLRRAALMIKELAGGEIASEVVDVYPYPKEKTTVAVKYHYLKKISGKNYHPDTVKKILVSLGFEVGKETVDELWLDVPFSKPDIELPADIAEEIMRIDGYDNIPVPGSITISPSSELRQQEFIMQEKTAGLLVGWGFDELFTNSITRSRYYKETELKKAVKLLNHLSAELDVMRISMIETGLEAIAYNLNRKNHNLRFFEFGKTYFSSGTGNYIENDHLCLYVSGIKHPQNWNTVAQRADLYYIKGIAESLLKNLGIETVSWKQVKDDKLNPVLDIRLKSETLGTIGNVANTLLKEFDIKQPVWIADFRWDKMLAAAGEKSIAFKEISRFPAVERDLAVIIDKRVPYEKVETIARSLNLPNLRSVRLFDVFESEKLGKDKKSMAINFVFLDEGKTLTDKEIDSMMLKLMESFESELNAEIRK